MDGGARNLRGPRGTDLLYTRVRAWVVAGTVAVAELGAVMRRGWMGGVWGGRSCSGPEGGTGRAPPEASKWRLGGTRVEAYAGTVHGRGRLMHSHGSPGHVCEAI